MRTYGTPIDVEPHDALLQEVRRTAGHVAWLNGVVMELAHEMDKGAAFSGLTQTNDKTLVQSPSVWVEMYQEERRMLARVCKMALDAGVAERTVKLAESQGALLAQLVQAVIEDPELGLPSEKKAVARLVFGRHMRALSSGAA